MNGPGTATSQKIGVSEPTIQPVARRFSWLARGPLAQGLPALTSGVITPGVSLGTFSASELTVTDHESRLILGAVCDRSFPQRLKRISLLLANSLRHASTILVNRV